MIIPLLEKMKTIIVLFSMFRNLTNVNRYNEEHTISSGNRSSSIKSLRESLIFER